MKILLKTLDFRLSDQIIIKKKIEVQPEPCTQPSEEMQNAPDKSM